MKLKKLIAAFAATTLLGLSGTAVMAKDIKTRIIRFGYGLSEESPAGQAATYFKKTVAELSGGKMKVQTVANGGLGPDEQLINSLIAGTGEVTYVSAAPLATHIKEFGVFDLPFLFNTHEVAYTVLDGPEGKKLLDMLPEKGLIGLNYWENGFRNLTNSKKEIKTAADLDGIKLRVMQNQVALAVFKGLGANALPMPFTELFSALETKTVDGQENPLTTIQTSKFYEVQPYLTISRHVYTPFVFMASKKWWEKLSDDEKAVITEAAQKSQQYQREISRVGEQKALEFLKEHGMKVAEFTDEERANIRTKLTPIINELKPKIGAATVDAIMNAAEQAAK